MIIQQTLERKEWLKNPPIARWLGMLTRPAQKFVKAQAVHTRRRAIAWYRSQYFISTAYSDMRLSIKRNEDIFIAVLLASGVIGYSLAVTAANLLFQSMLAVYVVADALGLNMAAVFGIAGFSYFLLLAWVSAWVQNMVAIAMWQSKNPTQRRSVRQTIREGLRHSSKITGVWAYIICLSALPSVAAAIAMLTAVMTGLYENSIALVALAVLGVGALALSIRMLIQLTLMPYVILFESEQTFKQAAKRSAQLIARRGGAFLFFGYLLFILSVAATSGICWLLLDRLLGLNWQILATFIGISLSVTANAMLASFYRKRRLARKN